MKISVCSDLSPAQKGELFRLWNNEYPVQLVYDSVDELDGYLQRLGNVTHYLLINERDAITGWAWTFDREDQRWFAIILDNSVQRMGYGSMLLSVLKENEAVLHGWVEDNSDKVKSNGESYLSPISFYQKNGFVLNPGDRLKTDKVSAIKITWMKGQ